MTRGNHQQAGQFPGARGRCSCGLRTWQPDDLEGFQQALTEAAESPGPAFVHMRIGPGHSPAPLLLEDPVTLGYRFHRWLADSCA